MSLFLPGRPVWSADTVGELYELYNEHLDYGSGTFLGKLRGGTGQRHRLPLERRALDPGEHAASRIDFDPGIGMSSATDVWLGAGITLPHSGGQQVGFAMHRNGRSWVGVTVSVPSGISWSFDDMAKVPGTSSYWGAGALISSSGSIRPVMFVYGALPADRHPEGVTTLPLRRDRVAAR